LSRTDTAYDSRRNPVRETVSAGATAYAVTDRALDDQRRPICQAQRMNLAALPALPANACAHGAEGAHGLDRITLNLYDAAGQRLQARDNDAYAWAGHYAVARAYTTNGLNQYTAAGGASFQYDPNGNLVADGTSTFTYDIENRLVGRSGGVVLSYDPLDRLFSVSSPTTATQFLYDGDALVGEYVSGVMTKRYVHNVGADVPLLSYATADLSQPSYHHADHQGSIVAISGPWGTGTVNSYDEYGIPAVTNSGRFQYTGQIWLDELGMYHYKARIYSPTLGRFLQTDPIGYQDQFNSTPMWATIRSTPPIRSACFSAAGIGDVLRCTLRQGKPDGTPSTPAAN
jgi:RHS repeat-associated protein